MKKLIKLPLLALLVLGMLFTSCQKEDEEFIDQTSPDTITNTSALTLLLLRTAQNDGDIDDILDGNSCVTVKFPVTVIVNGQKVILNSEEDLDIIEDIFDQFPKDEDTLEIVFPITVILEDYTEVVVNSQEELNALIAECENDGGNDAIGCVDFEYPITFFIYNDDDEQIGSVTVNNDIELLIFLQGLDDDDYFEIQFPINVILQDGSVVEVNSNEELEQIIEDCENDPGNDPVDPTEFEQLLTDGVWYVTYFFDDYDETEEFNGYEFTFESDNTASATNGSNTVPGTWEFSAGEDAELELFFGNDDPFDELDEDWEIIEATPDIIRLRDDSDEGSFDYLTFEREPVTGGGGGNTNEFIEAVTDGTWFVNLLDDDGDIETCDYVDYEFTFNLNGTATAVSPSNTVNGFWTVENDGGELDFILNFDITGNDDPFEDLNDDWEVLSFDFEFIELQDESGGSGGTDTLVFGREPATGCGGGGGGGNAQELRDVLSDGEWIVALYRDDGDDETSNYNGFVLDFNSNGTVIASNGSDIIDGTWAVNNSSEGLEVALDFGPDIPFDELNDDDWDVIEFVVDRVELQDISGGGGGTDELVFEKL